MEERYERNIGTITRTEQEILGNRRAAIVGCGGLGGYLIEFLARAGLGHLTLIDGDVFVASNLNRQLLSLEATLGKKKSDEAKKRALEVRPDLSVSAFDVYLDEENAAELLQGHDLILDALDNAKTRLLIEKTANTLGIPLVHGAVEGFCAQVCVVFPGDFLLSLLYGSAKGEAEKPSVLSFTPAFCASLQAAEAVKVLLKKEPILARKLLTADMRNCRFDIIDL